MKWFKCKRRSLGWNFWDFRFRMPALPRRKLMEPKAANLRHLTFKQLRKIMPVLQETMLSLPRYGVPGFFDFWFPLARISHTESAARRDKSASTSLRLLAVLNVLFKYASARQAARAS
jgi:hypothetical protein